MPQAPSRVAVVHDRGQLQVRATLAIAAGQPILDIDGTLVDRPTRYTIQIDDQRHVEARADVDGVFPPWRYLNHACSPNAALRERTLVAIEPIAAGAEVTFDYTTTEFDMSCPFPCACGSPTCLGLVRGFLHLTPEQQRARLPHLAPHLLVTMALPGNGSPR